MIMGKVCPIHPELNGLRHNGRNCPECVKATKADYITKNREKIAAKSKAYREKNAERIKQIQKEWADNNGDYIRNMNLRRTGFTLKLVEECIEMQGGKCAICSVELRSLPRKQVHADHCHGTTQARGVLCHHCNTGLGAFRDDPKRLLRAIEYLNNPTLEPLV